jgi:dCMP deaminase
MKRTKWQIPSNRSVKKEKRVSWDKFWFLIAMIYSVRGTCNRLRTACIIVNDNRLVGAGYNGSVSGLEHCDEVGHLIIEGHCERTLHAEENAILNTDRIHLKGATAYILGTPCIRCIRLLVNAGVRAIYYLGSYKNARGSQYLKEVTKHISFKQFRFNPRLLWQEAEELLQREGGIFRIAA